MIDLRNRALNLEMFEMAEKHIPVDDSNAYVRAIPALEKAWIKKGLENLRNQLIRARGKEVVGSEIHTLRGKEIQQLDTLYNKLEI